MQLSERLKKVEQYAELATRSEDLLLQGLGSDVAAIWDLIPDGSSGPQFLLRVNDRSDGQSSATFRPEELTAPAQLRHRLQEMKETLQRIGTWRKRLRALFDAVRGWCASLAPEWILAERPLAIREPRAGEYETAALTVSNETGCVELRPIAAWSPGTEGRADLIGREEEHVLIYSQTDGGWNWVDRRTAEFHPLTGELMVKLIRDCLT